MTVAARVTDDRASPRVLFRVACGPRQGFGHLLRALRLARRMGVQPLVSVRGSAAAVAAARRLGARPSVATTGELRRVAAHLLVVDDPNPRLALPWLARARQLGIPAASIHDLGLGADGADLVVDGSIGAKTTKWSARTQLLGPRYCVLDPSARSSRRANGPSSHTRGHVLVSLGGGPRRRVARRIARALVRHIPGVRVVVAGGFMSGPARRPEGGIVWLTDPAALGRACREAVVAVVGGGTTLYECCAAGTPAVALAVSPSQRPTIERFVNAGAVRDGGTLSPASDAVPRVVGLVHELMVQRAARRALASRGRDLVDGRGLDRVAQALAALARSGSSGREGTRARRVRR